MNRILKFGKIIGLASALVLVTLVFSSCVGPAEPEDGLVKDIPFVVNTESVFSFILAH